VGGSGSGVYIHCANGAGRTGTLAAAFLMLSRRLSPAEAVAQVQARRPLVALKRAQLAVLDRLVAPVAQDRDSRFS
jgi:protein-tyrosine phosphatase